MLITIIVKAWDMLSMFYINKMLNAISKTTEFLRFPTTMYISVVLAHHYIVDLYMGQKHYLSYSNWFITNYQITNWKYMQVTEKSINNSVVIWLMKKKSCRDPGSNQGPLDLQSNALPTELSRLHTSQLVQYKITYRELNSPVSIESSCVESCWVGRLSLALDSTGIARHCAVGLKLFGTIMASHCFHDDKVDCWVSRSPNLQ